MERLTATLRSSRILFFFLKGKANQKRITATWVSKKREEKGGERPESEGRETVSFWVWVSFICAAQHVGFSSPTRDQTHALCIGSVES